MVFRSEAAEQCRNAGSKQGKKLLELPLPCSLMTQTAGCPTKGPIWSLLMFPVEGLGPWGLCVQHMVDKERVAALICLQDFLPWNINIVLPHTTLSHAN